MAKILVLTREEVSRILSVKEANDLVEECFRAMALGTARNLRTTGAVLAASSGRCSIKSGYLESRGTLGIKIIRVHPENPRARDLPTLQCQIVVVDSETGEMNALLDGVHITRVRTGSAGAVGARFLARPDARRVAVIGAGVQGEAQLEALAADRPLGQAFVWSRTAERRERYAEQMSNRLGLEIKPTASIEDACRRAEIIVTATWSHQPLVRADWVQPGTYIAAIGADAQGMQELDATLLSQAKVVVDDLEQCVEMGEINVPVKDGSYALEQVHATIGEVVSGLRTGRTDAEEITIFDSTGIGIQDAVVADHVYRSARSMEIGTWVSI